KINLPKKITKSIPDIELFIPTLRNWNKSAPPQIAEIIQAIMHTLESITGKTVHISRLLFDELMQIAKDNHPQETYCVLRLKNGLLCEYILSPQTVSSEKSAIFFPHRIGRDRSIIASFHTHPSGVFTPSRPDLKSFRLNPVNVIMGSPYNSNSIGVYDSLGDRLDFKIW
ncbi:MAG: Mov34/MPN/PAD-1 family protein, partial [Candidatus Heimdallarchaeota archaeon]|nr:Mov34/MPN/PAD-1 family protein [Candidatus Heimdallarchaeota archaeon]